MSTVWWQMETTFGGEHSVVYTELKYNIVHIKLIQCYKPIKINLKNLFHVFVQNPMTLL